MREHIPDGPASAPALKQIEVVQIADTCACEIAIGSSIAPLEHYR